jgi:CDP-paratose synthetase
LKKKIILLGGGGFVGKYFAIKYHKLFDFYCIFNKKKINKNYFVESFQKTSDTKEIIKFFKRIKPDCVVNLATLYFKHHNVSALSKLIDSNIKFGCYILEAMKESSCSKIINFGSMFQHRYDQKYQPQNFYAATKQAFQDICYYYHLNYNIDCLSLKLFDTYGPNDTRKKILNLLISSTHKKEVLINNKNNKLNLVHVEDVCDAIKIAIDLICSKNRYFKSFCLPAKNVIKISDLIKKVEKYKKVNYKFLKNVNNKKFISFNSSYQKLKNWEPKINLEEGLKQCLKIN